jgi:hypothetical protein
MSTFLIVAGFIAFIFLLGHVSKKLPRGDRNDTGWYSSDSSNTSSSSDCSSSDGGCDGGGGDGGGGGD